MWRWQRRPSLSGRPSEEASQEGVEDSSSALSWRKRLFASKCYVWQWRSQEMELLGPVCDCQKTGKHSLKKWSQLLGKSLLERFCKQHVKKVFVCWPEMDGKSDQLWQRWSVRTNCFPVWSDWETISLTTFVAIIFKKFLQKWGRQEKTQMSHLRPRHQKRSKDRENF